MDPSVTPQASWYHLVYVPPASMPMQECISRASGIMLFVRSTTVSVRLATDNTEPDVEAAVRRSMDERKEKLYLATAHCDAIAKGLTITNSIQPKGVAAPPPDPEEATQHEVRSGKQSVISPVTGVPGARVVGANTKTQSANNRKSKKDEMTEAAQKEKATQEKAAARAKRQREEDVAATHSKQSKTNNPKPTRKKAGLSSPPSKTRTDSGDGSGSGSDDE